MLTTFEIVKLQLAEKKQIFEQKIGQVEAIRGIQALGNEIIQMGETAEAETWKRKVDSLSNTGKTLEQFFNEKTFTDVCRVFEEYLADIVGVIYENYIGFLAPTGTDININFSLVFESTEENAGITLLDFKRYFKESKVKNFMAGNSLCVVLLKFDTTFKLHSDIFKHYQSFVNVAFYSAVRNIITHNDGKINALFREQIERQHLKEPAKIKEAQKTANDFNGKIKIDRDLNSFVDNLMIEDIPSCITEAIELFKKIVNELHSVLYSSQNGIEAEHNKRLTNAKKEKEE